MDIRVLVGILAIVGGINLCLEDKWYGGWKRYFGGWLRISLLIILVFGFIHWLFNTQIRYEWFWFIRFVSGNLILMFLLNAKVCLDAQDEEADPSYGIIESSLPADTAILATMLGLIWLIVYGILALIR